jgi:hypothetical protein
MSVLELACELALLGPVLPLRGKIPMWKDWPTRASTTVNGEPEWNTATGVGLLTGKRAGYFVLDVDGNEGAETLAAWEHELDELPATWTSRTGGGGLHFFFRCPSDFEVRGNARKLGLGIDIRGEGGQVVAAGSRHPSGTFYIWEKNPAAVELAAAPEWLLDKLRPAPRLQPVANLVQHAPDADLAIKRASAYLAKIPGAVSGAGGHTQTWQAALAVVRGFSLSEEDAFALLASEYNPRCDPPWSEKELRHKVENAARDATIPSGYLLEAPAMKTPEVAKHSEPLFLPVDNFFATCGQAVEYILDPYLPRNGFLIIDGPPKIGKTWFLGWLAGEIAAKGHTVMFIEEEGSKETLRERLQPFTRPGAGIHISHRKGWKLDDERSLNRLIEEIKAAGASVLILDPLNQLHSHLRKIGDVPAEVILAIARIIRETGCSVILACHDRKGLSWDKNSNEDAQAADIAGSFAWAASADNIIAIKGVPNAERRAGEVRFYVSNPDTRNGEPFERRLAVVLPGPYRPESMTFLAPENRDAKELRRLLPYLPNFPEVISIKDLRDKASGRLENVGNAINHGIDFHLVGRRSGKGGGVYRVRNGIPEGGGK